MPESKGGHLTKENREVIAAGVKAKDSARKIAKRIDVSPSTVTREVKANRTIKSKKLMTNRSASFRCAMRAECTKRAEACESCVSPLTACKDCPKRPCIFTCPDFERVMCPETEKWPYVCPGDCPKRGRCTYPKCSYDAEEAHKGYTDRLRDSRSGIAITPEQLSDMDGVLTPLVRQGQSFEAIWAEHGDEMPVGVRTAYNYQEAGLLSCANIELPRKAKCRPRKRAAPRKRDRIDRTGRTYADFQALPLQDQARVVQGDSVEGYAHNTKDILSLHMVACAFQFYLHKDHASTEAVVAWYDAIERALGSPEAFEALMGVQLVDRGVEFDDWAGMERSCLVPGAQRCRVFYCDPMKSNQKSPAERNHQQLRRILPKGRSDFDKLGVCDVAVCCCHVNSYPSAGRGGKCPFELASGLIPQVLLDELGLARIAPDDVILKPSLMKHAVIQ